jgi:ferrous iron transport protein B
VAKDKVNSRKIALVGNPNSGKSTLFNALTGLHQKTGNFPGVTVDKKTARVTLRNAMGSVVADYIDLPGTYSLHAKSLDEEVATNVLIDENNEAHPDVVIIVADATNLKRSLFLAGQIIDLGVPSILALNMMDEADAQGIHINHAVLQSRLGIPIVPVSAREKTGLQQLQELLVQEPVAPQLPFISIANLAPEERKQLQSEHAEWSEYKCLVKLHQEVKKDSTRFHSVNSSALQAEETLLRYGTIASILDAIQLKQQIVPARTRQLDRLLTHKIGGFIIFFVLLFLVFQTIFFLAEYPMMWIEDSFAWMRDQLISNLPSGFFTDLLTNGILAGLSGVVVFIPQIALLFFFIAMLEDSGYMARVSFIMDKVMRKFGLHGRSVIPLISGMACAVPAIMGTRTISNWKERIITIMIIPFMSCSARLPVYTLLIALVVPDTYVGGVFNLQALAMMGLYLFGFVIAIGAAFIMSKLMKSTEKSWFILELPVYRIPQWSNVCYTIYDKVKVFLTDAGKVIIAVSIVLWILAGFGPGEEFKHVGAEITLLQDQHPEPNDSVAHEIKIRQAKQLELSYAGRIGKTIEPIIAPLGYDWKIGISLLTSLAAREVFVGTMATIYGAGDEENTDPIREVMQREKHPDTGLPVYSFATGISLMIFYAIALQCISTIAVVRRETKSWMWPGIQFIGMGLLAWICSFAVFQLLS